MAIRIFTIPFDPEREIFQEEDLSRFLLNKRVKRLTPKFFQLDGHVYWTVCVEYESVVSVDESGDVERFPRNARFSLASRLADMALETMELIIEAIYTKNRLHILNTINLYMEKQRVLFRIAHDRRYMDDFVIFGDSKHKLVGLRAEVQELLSERLQLFLRASATYVNRSHHGLSFLGMRIFPRLIRVKPKNRRRSLKKLRVVMEKWERGDIDEETAVQSTTSIVGHLRYFCPNMRMPSGVGII